MPIPRNWSEELISEWLQLLGYLTEMGIPLPGTGKGGRQEADVVGTKIIESESKGKVLQIFHVEVGELGGNYESNVHYVRNKFSSSRTEAIINRINRRMGFLKPVEYKKLYVDIWATRKKIDNLTSNLDLRREGIEIWTLEKLFQGVLRAITDWVPDHGPKPGEATLPESYWMLKMIEALREWRLFNISSSTI
jgi:hypothetical protein